MIQFRKKGDIGLFEVCVRQDQKKKKKKQNLVPLGLSEENWEKTDFVWEDETWFPESLGQGQF